MANVLLITHWTGGDVLPFVKMGTILKEYGHDVTIFTHCIYKEIALSVGLNFEALDDIHSYNTMVRDFPLLSDPINNISGVIEFQKKYHGVSKLIDEYNLIAPYCNRKDTILLYRHRSSVSALLVAEKLKLPAISVFLAPNYLSHMELHEELMGRELCSDINIVRAKLELPMISSWMEWICSSKRMIGLWPKWFADRENYWPKQLEIIGFLKPDIGSKDILPKVKELFDLKKPIVLVTGGTSRMISSSFYEVAAKACVFAGVKCILVVPFEDLVSDQLSPEIVVVHELNIRLILDRVDAIIHHGGIGTLSEALLYKVPQIILPQYADRPENAQRMSMADIAISFPPIRWQADRIAKSISSVVSREFREEYIKKLENLETFNHKLLSDIISEVIQ